MEIPQEKSSEEYRHEIEHLTEELKAAQRIIGSNTVQLYRARLMFETLKDMLTLGTSVDAVIEICERELSQLDSYETT